MSDRELSLRPHSAFRELRAEVAGVLGDSRKGGAAMLAKAALLIGHWAAWYVAVLIVGRTEPVLALLMTPFVAVAFVAVMFAVMHDGSHGAVSERRWLNRLAGGTLIAAGASAVSWHHEHVVAHHRHTNVPGLDPDLESGGLLRFHPGQQWRPLHRWQHVYAWFGYALVSFKWAWFEDFDDLFRNRHGLSGGARVRHALDVVFAKCSHVAIFIVLPATQWGLALAVGFYFLYFVLVSEVLATVFVIAHLSGPQSMPDHRSELPEDWALFQVATTANFAASNRWLTWLLGGLNMQIEHHLFPAVGHRHYANIRPIVKAWAARHGVRYLEHPTLFGAVMAHFRHLRRLGSQPDAST